MQQKNKDKTEVVSEVIESYDGGWCLVNLPRLLLNAGLSKSIAEGKRLITQGAVRIYHPKGN